ncbi:SMP-30/gluconolactonase/LRE family protein [Brevundimonas sp. SL161]|uniref:SMP-30/gluconolactonase/LRE family protein n=1 Tax=Brevundimonas sp. SL161 TaxID=2804613 RepID=UPI003CEAB1DC
MPTAIDIEPILLADGLVFPEGPAFASDGALWGVEMNAGGLFRWADGELTRLNVGGKPNGLAIHDGSVLFCDAAQDAVFRLASDWREDVRIEPVAETVLGRALTAPNDLIFDPSGAMIFTCPGDSKAGPMGTVWVRSPDGDVALVAEALHFPNGLTLTPDGRDLIVAETLGQRLWRGGWNGETRAWADPRPWVEVGGAPLGPDGMAYAPDGLLYVALYGSGLVQAIDDTGRIVRTFPVPGDKPTNLAFDPSGELGMVVTEATNGLLLSYPGVGAA